MATFLARVSTAVMLAVAIPSSAWSSDEGAAAATAPSDENDWVLAQAAQNEMQEAEPDFSSESAPPAEAPPAPPSRTPPAPPAQAQAQGSPAPAGQWVYTQQYGWVWMPYGDAYTYAPPDGYGEPYMYVYVPVTGWAWVGAPWVWGWGPWPFFGFIGPRHFAWYGHGWWRYPWRWHYRPVPFPGAFGQRFVLRGGVLGRGAPGHAIGGRVGGGGHPFGGGRSGGRHR
jgi:hypothetical protein